jgi:hypothetical protein
VRLVAPPRALALVLVLVLAGCAEDEASRQDEVAERGAEVMPFDLDATTHVFRPDDRGGVQEVVADDPGDGDQVALVRAHLAEEAERFADGDFEDPMAIHGHQMPGLAELVAGHEDIDVSYEDLEGGARLTYRTDDPVLVTALHEWFDAQLADHGEHAEAG